jgi:hypothetical protein
MPTKTVLAAISATASLLAAVGAAAATPFDAFKTVCGTPAAELAAVTKAADAAGWAPSDTAADANMPNVTVTGTLARATSVEKTGLVLTAWQGANKAGVKISDCTVHIAKGDLGRARAAAAAWLAFAPQEGDAKRAIFRFTPADGGPKAVDKAEFDAAAGGSGLEILTVSSDASGAVLDLMMIKK